MGFHATILTLYPEMFPGPLGNSLAGKALEKKIWSLKTYQIRNFATDRHRSVDDTPAGGGAGMVMRADILAHAIDDISSLEFPRFLMSPRGLCFNQAMAYEIASLERATFICSRFEGVDERIIEARNLIEISVGDYILSGGEIAVLVILDAVIRLLHGVIGNVESQHNESFENGLLEHPQYTRPQIFEDQEIPQILSSGDHRAILEWRKSQAEAITKVRRPDLWSTYQKKHRKT
ncbi:MAG: tRNA (guanine37-N1)-methyltransferase [Candidatus Tokpelaia sp. JSC188]|nr:MAG: tRNA (guanine37-N1)-methyltransferase [Candidatus Tokpelaia sp. JSC188]